MSQNLIQNSSISNPAYGKNQFNCYLKSKNVKYSVSFCIATRLLIVKTIQREINIWSRKQNNLHLPVFSPINSRYLPVLNHRIRQKSEEDIYLYCVLRILYII
jgi:hypothetical protein